MLYHWLIFQQNKLNKLNSIVWPAIRALAEEEIKQGKSQTWIIYYYRFLHTFYNILYHAGQADLLCLFSFNFYI